MINESLIKVLEQTYFNVLKNKDFFSFNQKSHLEICELMVIAKEDKYYNESLSFLYSEMIGKAKPRKYIDLFQKVEYSKLSQYRICEILAIDQLYNNYDHSEEIRKLFKRGFFYNLVNNELPLELLSNRNFLYAITHEIMYCSIFNSNNKNILDLIHTNKKLIEIFNVSISMCLRNDDIDVLNELIYSILVLEIEQDINSTLLQVSCDYIEKSIDKKFLIRPNNKFNYSLLNEKDYFKSVYHTTLTGGFIYGIYKQRYY